MPLHWISICIITFTSNIEYKTTQTIVLLRNNRYRGLYCVNCGDPARFQPLHHKFKTSQF